MNPDSWRKNLWLIITLFLVAVPVLLWLEIAPLSVRFGGLAAVLGSLGQLTGLVGFTLFALTLVLASKHPILKKIFPDISLIYRKHHFLGGLAFVLLLIHPLALFLKITLSSISAALRFLIPTLTNPAKIAGVSSLLLMAVLLFLTFFTRPRYETWKKTHRFLALAFFLGSLHIFLLQNGDLSQSLPLRIYMLSFAALGLTAMGYGIIRARWRRQFKKA